VVIGPAHEAFTFQRGEAAYRTVGIRDEHSVSGFLGVTSFVVLGLECADWIVFDDRLGDGWRRRDVQG